jgi:hypothetical protein
MSPPPLMKDELWIFTSLPPKTLLAIRVMFPPLVVMALLLIFTNSPASSLTCPPLVVMLLLRREMVFPA